VIQGAFRGAGQTKVAMALSFLSRWVFRIPVAIALAFSTLAIPGTAIAVEGLGIGVTGIWAAFSVGAFASFLLAVFWFRLGRWTEGVIEDEPGAAAEPTVADDAGPDAVEEPPVEDGTQPVTGSEFDVED